MDVKLTLPHDLTATQWDWLLDSENEEDEKMPENLHTIDGSGSTFKGWSETSSSSSYYPSICPSLLPRKSPTSSPSAQQQLTTSASPSFFAAVGKQASTAPSPPATENNDENRKASEPDLQFDSLFNAGDPIWKPIFEDTTSVPASYWPSKFAPGWASDEADNKPMERKTKKD